MSDPDSDYLSELFDSYDLAAFLLEPQPHLAAVEKLEEIANFCSPECDLSNLRRVQKRLLSLLKTP